MGANATLSMALEFSLHMSAMNLSPYLLEIPGLLGYDVVNHAESKSNRQAVAAPLFHTTQVIMDRTML